ncbi:MAG: hypothetical protein K9G59_04755 [Caulobacter sp.]|nr:hypothetical protein [Caulobacter sp.]
MVIHVGLILILRRAGNVLLGLQLVDRQGGAGDHATQPHPPFQGDVGIGFGEGGEVLNLFKQPRGQPLGQSREQRRRAIWFSGHAPKIRDHRARPDRRCEKHSSR